VQARHLEENFDLAKNALDILVDNVVGLGIRPEPQVRTKDGKPHKEYNKALMKLWIDWVNSPEVTGELDYYSMQRIEARTLFRDGEYLKQYIEGNQPFLKHKTKVPFSIELLEPDLLPLDYTDYSNKIIQGVEKNTWGQPVAYHVYKDHPGNRFLSSTSTKRVSSDNMAHVKMVNRMGQTRGITVFASVLNRFDDIKDICEAENVAARVSAAFTFYIKKGGPDQYFAPQEDEAERDIEMAPGMGLDNLRPGEEYGTIDSNRPNNGVVPYVGFNIRGAAGGVGVSYSSLSKEYMGNWSSRRQEANEQYSHYGTLWSYFVQRSVKKDWHRFAKMAQFVLDVPDDVDTETLLNADYSRPPMVVIDPKAELAAIEKELELQLVSKSRVQRRRGDHPDDVRSQIAQDALEDEEAGLPVPEYRKNDAVVEESGNNKDKNNGDDNAE
jgi:lambda family phage portal protein